MELPELLNITQITYFLDESKFKSPTSTLDIIGIYRLSSLIYSIPGDMVHYVLDSIANYYKYNTLNDFLKLGVYVVRSSYNDKITLRFYNLSVYVDVLLCVRDNMLTRNDLYKYCENYIEIANVNDVMRLKDNILLKER